MSGDSTNREFDQLFSGKPDGVPCRSTRSVGEIRIGQKFAHIESCKYARPDGESWWMASWFGHREGLTMVVRRGDTRDEAVQKVIDDLTEDGFGV